MLSDADSLPADDARILAMESSSVTGHTLKLIELAPGDPVDLDALRAAVGSRARVHPRASQRIDASGDRPRWVSVPSLDLGYHVRRRAGAECATRADLWAVVGDLMSEHLDRTHPLWTLDLIGPLADGSEAIALRTHHAMLDGIAGVRFLEAVVAEPADAPVHDVGTHVDATLPPAQELRRMPAAFARELGHPGGRSPFDLPVSIRRELSFVAVPLSGLRRVGSSRASHATVNDVLLAVVAGALRAWLPAHATRHRLRAQIPVSLHHRDEDAAGPGNRDSFINVDLPVDEPDPLRRLDRISAQTRREKQADDAVLMYDLLHALGRFGAAGAAVQQLADGPREFAVAISNVPGPRGSIAVAGRRVARIFSSSEPAPRHALRISALSSGDEVGIGFCTDPAALPGIAALARAAGDAYADLARAADGGGS